jgi:hypothetical protein
MNIDLNKTLNELTFQIVDLIDVEEETVKEIASSTNGQFVLDRVVLPAREFLSKYFPGYQVFDTYEQQEARRKAQTTVAKVKKAKRIKETLLDQYGNYILALWQCGDEFSASYRKTTNIGAHWHVLNKNEVEYKKDGRKFAVVQHLTSRNEALAKKVELIQEMMNRNMIYRGELPV